MSIVDKLELLIRYDLVTKTHVNLTGVVNIIMN